MAALPVAEPRTQTRRPGLQLLRVSAPERRQATVASYRLQFSPEFGFRDAERLAPWLASIGITHVYASPIMAARSGSTHGYDVTDPGHLNPALGSHADFLAFTNELHRHGLGLIVDIVPNHMAASWENAWWRDVLEAGRCSAWAHFFDIDWDNPICPGRIVLPVLGADLADVLRNGQLRLSLDDDGLVLNYWEHRFPVRLGSYARVFGRVRPDASGWRPDGENAVRTWLSSWRFSDTAVERSRVKRSFRDLLTSGSARAFAEAVVNAVNDDSAELAAVLDEQHYVLAYWRTGRPGYRRFFDVNELVAVRVEDEHVFGTTHRFAIELAADGCIDGLRIDHIDGLRQPTRYLSRLRRALDDAGARNTFIAVEKILMPGEQLPRDWHVAGTTGYDFLTCANGVFVSGNGLRRLEEAAAQLTACTGSFDDLAYAAKRYAIENVLDAEFTRLRQRLEALGFTNHAQLARALEEVAANMPVYRTYIERFNISAEDRDVLEAAVAGAVSRNPDAMSGQEPAVRSLLLLDAPRGLSHEQMLTRLDFLLSWQQNTGPLMAKAVEDTVFYRYNRLTSLNTIGGNSRPVAPGCFHAITLKRALTWPAAMNATSTHDAKLGEDVRSRINVLSELPEQWMERVRTWTRWNFRHKRAVGGQSAPAGNDEFLLYQILAGAWPLEGGVTPEFIARIEQFMLKAVRQAKQHTSWTDPDAEYENALADFVRGVLDTSADNPFVADFEPFQRWLAPFGAVNSLAQVLLKAAAPGSPDFYQGSTLWDFCLVDPDNRRPVAFDRRVQLCGDMNRRGVAEIKNCWRDGCIKMFVTARTLRARREHAALFASGSYIPLEVSGPQSNHVLAFARRFRDEWAIAIVPRLLASMCPHANPFEPGPVWKSTIVHLPARAPAEWHDAFTDCGHAAKHGALPLNDVLSSFPMSLLLC